HRHLHL
ncbi:hypothetical protein BN1723_019352, partial [Verticillium longisporum]